MININREEMQESQQKIPTAIGIMAGLRNKPVSIEQIQSQVRAVRERGLGISLIKRIIQIIYCENDSLWFLVASRW